ncbi:dethiobiotin synthase [Brevibacillus choshinensis]|uniref:ATP-dependent dethiobiotin synthetase BioD n=1 Tax=Brevibacillus choshinensis TaxID=54911 RepID=A0ABX7FQ14_BRECH|nr:dethiobiotin synthase [Brevibacillus choshinensis]QRG67387.1 dethiobiotin synthase [Brevibacillus choshinensis]
MNEERFAGLFIAGTDTGVGKTIVTAGLTAALREEGMDVGVWKPVMSGALASEEESDAYRLHILSGVKDLPEEIAPLVFPAPLTPLLAAKAAGQELSMEQVLAGGRTLRERHRFLLVEGAGGLAVPLTETEMIVDVAVQLKLPLLLVARAGLGTINHTLLSIWYAREKGVRVAGVILNETTRNAADDASIETNASMIERYGDVPVWGSVPGFTGPITRPRLLEIMRQYVDLAGIRLVLQTLGIGGELS